MNTQHATNDRQFVHDCVIDAVIYTLGIMAGVLGGLAFMLALIWLVG